MVWAKLDDGILDNPKIVRVGPIGFALHAGAITWCARNLTDGFIPKQKAKQLLPTSWDIESDDGRDVIWTLSATSGYMGIEGDELVDGIVRLLVKVGLWHEETDERGNYGYRIHDYDQYNPTRAEVLEEREKKRLAGIAGGRSSAAQRQARAQADAQPRAEAPAQAESKQRAKQNSTPVPDPVPILEPNGSRGAQAPRKRASRLSEDWNPDEKDCAYAKSKNWSAEKTAEQAERFKAHHVGKGTLMMNWNRAWQSWVLREPTYRGALAPISGRFPAAPPSGPTYHEKDDPEAIQRIRRGMPRRLTAQDQPAPANELFTVKPKAEGVG
jgi:hypothetical protein